MSRIMPCVLVMSLAFAAGCQSRSSHDDTAVTDKLGAFMITVPEVAISRGQTKVISVAVKRRNDFAEEVVLDFASPERGLSIAPSTIVVTQGTNDAKVKLIAESECPPNEYTMTITGSAGTATVTTPLKVKVK